MTLRIDEINSLAPHTVFPQLRFAFVLQLIVGVRLRASSARAANAKRNGIRPEMAFTILSQFSWHFQNFE
jgi:hypothetical protein